MHVGINALTLRRGAYSGVHVAVRGLIRAVAGHAPPDDRFTLYVQRKVPAGLPEPAEGRVRHVRPLWPAGWRAGRIAYEQFRLHARVFRDGVDLLHCPAYVCPHGCLKPVVISVHDAFALRMPGLCTAANRSHFRRMMPRSLSVAKRIVTPTEYVRRELLAYNRDVSDAAAEGKAVPRGVPVEGLAERIRVVPWGVDDRFRPVSDESRREEVALRYGLPPRFALYVGRIEPKKNVEQAIRAYFAAVMARGLPHRLVLAGPRGWGVEKKTLALVRNLDLSRKVLRIGFVPDEDLPALYGMADALLFPSLTEGFGLPVLEAMACGTPVVCTDIPALAEVAGDAALRVPPGDLPALREAVESALTDESVRARLREKGLARAAGFTWARHARDTLALYREVILEDRQRHDASE